MKKKVNFKAVWEFLVFVSCCGILIYDFYMISIRPFFVNKLIGFTPFGLVTFILAMIFANESGSYLIERIKK